MKILEFYYDDDSRYLLVEFSIKEDGDDFYRKIELDTSDVLYYSPEIIDEEDLNDIDKQLVKDILKEYFKHNELPEQLIL